MRTQRNAPGHLAVTPDGYLSPESCTFAEYVRREMMRLQEKSSGGAIDHRVMPRGVLRILQLLQQEHSRIAYVVQLQLAKFYMGYVSDRGSPVGVEHWVDTCGVDPQYLSSYLGDALLLLREKLRQSMRPQAGGDTVPFAP